MILVFSERVVVYNIANQAPARWTLIFIMRQDNSPNISSNFSFSNRLRVRFYAAIPLK